MFSCNEQLVENAANLPKNSARFPPPPPDTPARPHRLQPLPWDVC